MARGGPLMPGRHRETQCVSTRELCPGAHPEGHLGLLSLSWEAGPMPRPSLLLQDVGQSLFLGESSQRAPCLAGGGPRMRAACRCSGNTFVPEGGQSDVGRTGGQAQKQGRRWSRGSSFGCTMDDGSRTVQCLSLTENRVRLGRV